MNSISNSSAAILKGVPKYTQIKEELKRKILVGEWKANSMIPTENQLCEQFGVSRITIRAAIEELQQEGYIQKIQGKGTFVRGGAIEQRLSKFYTFGDELKKRGYKEVATMIEFLEVEADEDLADHLKIIPGEKVYKITRTRSVESGPYALETSYIPVADAPGMTEEEVNHFGLYKSMAAKGCYVQTAIESFTAVNLDQHQAALLETDVNKAAISLIRTTFSGQRIVEYCVSFVRGDFFSYSVTLS